MPKLPSLEGATKPRRRVLSHWSTAALIVLSPSYPSIVEGTCISLLIAIARREGSSFCACININIGSYRAYQTESRILGADRGLNEPSFYVPWRFSSYQYSANHSLSDRARRTGWTAYHIHTYAHNDLRPMTRDDHPPTEANHCLNYSGWKVLRGQDVGVSW